MGCMLFTGLVAIVLPTLQQDSNSVALLLFYVCSAEYTEQCCGGVSYNGASLSLLTMWPSRTLQQRRQAVNVLFQ